MWLLHFLRILEVSMFSNRIWYQTAWAENCIFAENHQKIDRKHKFDGTW